MTRTRRKGLTIIEVVMALVILAVALPTLVTAFADASRQSIQPVQGSVASFLAIERMEEIIARRYRGTDGYTGVTTANFPAESPVSGFTGFDRSVSVTLTDASLNTVMGDEGYKLVRVTVSFNAGNDEVVLERVFADF